MYSIIPHSQLNQVFLPTKLDFSREKEYYLLSILLRGGEMTMAPHAKVFVAEDDPVWLKRIREQLETAGHHVVGEATTREKVLQQIPTFRETGVDVVILGGNLGGHVNRGDSPDNDSIVILKALKEAGYGDLPTVGLSGLELPGATVDLGKEHFGIGRLGETVTGLPAFRHKEM